MPKFYTIIMIIARKVFYPIFFGGGGVTCPHYAPAPPVSYTYASNMLIVNYTNIIIIVPVCIVGIAHSHVPGDVT